MNKWNYNEQYMECQLDYPNLHLGTSPYTVADSGCFSAVIVYAGHKLKKFGGTLGQFVEAANQIDGYTIDGLLKWDAIKKLTGLKVSKDKPLWGNYCTMRMVWYPGVKTSYQHWVMELHGGLMFDPMKKGGNLVHEINFFAPVLNTKKQIERRYIKA